MVEGFNATQRELEILELRKEVSALKTNVEYWRLAAERRDTRKELTGLDVPEARTLDAPEPPQCEVQTDEPVAWVVFADNGNVRLWGKDRAAPQAFADKNGLVCEPVFRRALTSRGQADGGSGALNQKTRCENCNLLARCDDPLCPNGVAQTPLPTREDIAKIIDAMAFATVPGSEAHTRALHKADAILALSSAESSTAAPSVTQCPRAGCLETIGDTRDPGWDQGQCGECGKWFWRSSEVTSTHQNTEAS